MRGPRPRPERRRASSGCTTSEQIALAHAGESASGTMIPASAMTSGSEPLLEAITGTPDAIASTATLPNCSTQVSVV